MDYLTLFCTQRTILSNKKGFSFKWTSLKCQSKGSLLLCKRGIQYILKSKYTRILTESDPTLGTGFLWTFSHNGAHIDFCFELEGRVWIGSANILILHSQDEETLSEEKNTNRILFLSGERKVAENFFIQNSRYISTEKTCSSAAQGV